METTFALQEYLRKIIVSQLAQVLSKNLTTVLDLPLQYDAISVQIKKGVRDNFQQYGVELVDLIIEAITLPPDVQEAINRAAGTRAVGRDELQHYERVGRTDALRDAVQQPGGGTASEGLTAGLGLGAGMELAREMAGQAAPSATPSPSEPAKMTVDQLKAKLKELKELVDEGLINESDFEEQKKKLLSQM
jgi:membrane protease subunit (stomatin/prohibitin family)